MKKTLLASAMTAMTLATFTPAVMAYEIGASAGVANTYLWRGYDLGGAAVSGDLNISEGGAYAGVWTSAGDLTSGTEYDLYVGYGGDVQNFSYDISYWTYAYPEVTEGGIDPGELAEVIGTLGYGPFSYSLYYDASKDSDDRDWTYMTLSAEKDQFGVLVGKHNDSLLHVDLSYAYNDNLSFILSVPADEEEGAGDPKVVVSYSLPLQF